MKVYRREEIFIVNDQGLISIESSKMTDVTHEYIQECMPEELSDEVIEEFMVNKAFIEYGVLGLSKKGPIYQYLKGTENVQVCYEDMVVNSNFILNQARLTHLTPIAKIFKSKDCMQSTKVQLRYLISENRIIIELTE